MNEQLSKLKLFDLKVRLKDAKSADMISLLTELVSLGPHAVDVEQELTEKIEEGVYFPRVDRLAEVVANARSSELLKVIQASEQITLNSSAHAILLEAGFGESEKELISIIEQEYDTDPLGGWNWRQILNSLIKAGTQQSTDTLEWFESKLSDRIDALRNKASNALDTPSSIDEILEPKYLIIYEEMLALTSEALAAVSKRPSYIEQPKTQEVDSAEPEISNKSMIGSELNLAIERVELKLRELIATTLEASGEQIPQHVINKVQERIDGKLSKCALTNPEQFASLSGQLEYFDIRDLHAAIASKQLWKSFEPIFKNKPDLNTRFDQLCSARNPVRHSRSEHEIYYMDGKTAVAWFTQILTSL
tara:strand:- start:10172 stop:11260 length:1089 start_codon:yes stop_codon:yes gene_type:complete